MADMFDQQLAQFALRKGNSSDKTFAQQVMPVHTKATHELKILVMNGKLNVTIPTSLNSEQQQKLQSIQKLSGRQFEIAFRTYESQNHAEEISYAERYVKTGQKPRAEILGEHEPAHAQRRIEPSGGAFVIVGSGIVES